MSHGDYLTLKKIKTKLTINKLPSVLEYNDYYHFADYSLENKIVNNSITYNLLPLPDTTQLYNIVVNKNIATICDFCAIKSLRLNRKLHIPTKLNTNIPLNMKQIKKNNEVKNCMCK